MNSVFMSNDFVKAVDKDYSEAFAILNPANSATLTQIIANNGVKPANNTIIQRTVKNLSKSNYSGGKAEGSAAGDAEKSETKTIQNYMEIFSKIATVSGTAKAMNSNIYGEELMDRMSEIKEDINSGILKGVLSSTDPRKMCGMTKYSDVNTVNLAAEVLTEEELDTAIQKLATKGKLYLAVNQADMFAVQRALIGDKATINLATTETVAGINVTKYISAQGVTVNLYAENALDKGTYVLYDMDKVDYYELRPIEVIPLAKNGDSDSAEVICEVSNIALPNSVAVLKHTA